jgi:hypothetical protein
MAPYNGGEEIDVYEIEVLTPQDVFVTDPTCTGQINLGTTCLFPHSYLIETYGFRVGDILQIRVRAHNKNGWGDFS